MTKLKLYYEGWLALPETFRQALGLNTNAVLEAELVAGTIVLRPAGEGRGATRPEPEAADLPSLVTQPPAPALTEVPARRKPGRPRKTASAVPRWPVTASRPRASEGRARSMPPHTMPARLSR